LGGKGANLAEMSVSACGAAGLHHHHRVCTWYYAHNNTYLRAQG
jgi:hypothetical protein